MMTNKLTVVIAYLNESKELPRTIEEIRATAGYDVDIIAVDDASDDEYDFSPLFEKYKVRYIRNNERCGCGPSRDIGIRACSTPYIFIIDGHMRFYDSFWHKEIISALDENPSAIYCCKCKPVSFDTGEDMKNNIGYGTYISVLQPEKRHVLEPIWLKPADIKTDQPIVEIPCIFGACYAASVDYWNLLRGFEGITFFSCDEQYISIKAWMEGGGCRLLNNVTIGHLFRTKATYDMMPIEFYHNKLVILQTLFPEELSRKAARSLKSNNVVEYIRAKESLNVDLITELKEYYAKTFKYGFDNFLKINNKFNPN